MAATREKERKWPTPDHSSASMRVDPTEQLDLRATMRHLTGMFSPEQIVQALADALFFTDPEYPRLTISRDFRYDVLVAAASRLRVEG